MIEPVADSLRIPIHRIYANNLLFSNTADGTFEGFDTNELTSRDGGKPAVLNRLIALYGYESIVMMNRLIRSPSSDDPTLVESAPAL